MCEEDVTYERERTESMRDDTREGRYYLSNGLWTHPETGGDFYFDDERKNK